MTELRHITTRATEGDDGTIRFIASTNTVDRYGTIVSQNWDLTNFNKNPVFLWMHDYRRTPIGRVMAFEVGEEQSEAVVEFADTEFAQEVKSLYLGGYLNAVSVGFKPGARTWNSDDTMTYGTPEDPNELYELSGVTVPGNADAIAKAKADGLSIRAIEAYERDATPMLDVLRSIDERMGRFEAMAHRIIGKDKAETKSEQNEDEDEVVLVLTDNANQGD